MKLTIIILSFLMFLPFLSISQDYNGNGFEYYKKGEFKKAYDLFRKSTEAYPDNHFGWYNLARTTFILNKSSDPEDPCDAASNWEFEVLSYLSKSYDINAESVLKLVARQEPNFDAFKEKNLFKKWQKAATFNQNAPTDIKSWIQDLSWTPLFNNQAESPDYEFKEDGSISKSGIFNTSTVGTWKIESNKIKVDADGESLIYTIEMDHAAFDSGGKNKFYTLYLKASIQSKVFPDLVLGPRYGDCGQYNY